MFAWLRRDWPIAALVLLAVIFIAPLWCVSIPAMPDFPAHLAGFHLITGGANSAPLSTFYSVHWLLLPNLASELVVPVLAQAMPLEAAAKVFLSIAVVMWVCGAALIQRALTGKIGAASLIGALFATNANYTWGFMNYTFASGLSFVVFAAWIWTRNRRTPWVLAGFAAAIFFLYVAHLFGACVLAVLIGSFELSAALRQRNFSWSALIHRGAPVALIFLPAAITFLFFKSAGGEGGGVEFNYGDTIGDRFGSAAQWVFSDPAYLVIGGLAILVFAGLAYGKVRIHPAMKLLVITMAILAMVAPEWALGGWGVDMRLPAVLGVITFASLELRGNKWLPAGLAALTVLVAAGNATTLTLDWLKHDRQYSEFRIAIRDIPKGSKIFTVLDGDALDDVSDQPYWHMAELAILDREAFTPLMFTTKGQHVVQLKAPYDQIAAATAKQGSPPDVTELLNLSLGREKEDSDIKEVFPYLKFFQCHYNYAVVVHGSGEQADVPVFMSLHYAGSFFSIYKIRPTGLCSMP